MSVKPILFNAEMIRPVLDGRKTVTRRVIKPQPVHEKVFWNLGGAGWSDNIRKFTPMPCHSLYNRIPYKPGDILYARETWTCWRAHRYEAHVDIKYLAGGEDKRIYFSDGNTDRIYRDDYDLFVKKWYRDKMTWHPSIHMPKEAARIWLKVTDVRVERLQDMRFEDCLAEGAFVYLSADGLFDRDTAEPDAKKKYAQLWDSTIKKKDLPLYGWDVNPHVWAIEFERIEKPKGE